MFTGRHSLVVLAILTACGGSTSPGDAGADATVDAPLDAAAPDYGQCGQTTHACLCACDGGASCETDCYAKAPACTTCIDTAATSCCPTEYPAYTKCIGDAQKPSDAGPGCASSDTACILARCKSESSALQTCLQTSGCTTAYAKCKGTATCR